MKELHALVDYENVHPSLEALAKLAPGFSDVWLFHGPHQAKQAQAFAANHERVTLVPRSSQGPNALDFHVAFYLGYVAAKHPDAELVAAPERRVSHHDNSMAEVIDAIRALMAQPKPANRPIGFTADVTGKVVNR